VRQIGFHCFLVHSIPFGGCAAVPCSEEMDVLILRISDVHDGISSVSVRGVWPVMMPWCGRKTGGPELTLRT